MCNELHVYRNLQLKIVIFISHCTFLIPCITTWSCIRIAPVDIMFKWRGSLKIYCIYSLYAYSYPLFIDLYFIHAGQRCGHGNKTPRQTTIVLNCAVEESRPVVHSEDDNCNYEIWFDTPSACPIKVCVTTLQEDKVHFNFAISLMANLLSLNSTYYKNPFNNVSMLAYVMKSTRSFHFIVNLTILSWDA